MFKTKALSSFKSIFPPIHQPLPLDKRESKKLLDALTSSFRAHLDREHGSPGVTTPFNLPSTPTVKYLPFLSNPSEKASERPSERPTDRHLRAILNNPLFSHNEATPAASLLRPSSGANPKEVFERAVAKGLMTLPRAHGFLLRVAEDIRGSSTMSVHQGMRESGAGLQVVQWLRASGQERDLSFLSNARFTQNLIHFMVAEGLNELAWSWLQRLIDGTGPFALGAGPKQGALLLRSLVAAQSEAVELDEAYSSVLKADSLFREHSSPPKLLVWAWLNVARKTTVDSWRHKTPGVDLFESFLDVGQRVPTAHSLENAHLDLYHPTKPSPNRAVEYLSNDEIWQKTLPDTLSQWRTSGKNSLPVFLKLLKLLSFDTMQHLVKIGELEEAERILGRISTYLVSPQLDPLVRTELEAAMRGFRSH